MREDFRTLSRCAGPGPGVCEPEPQQFATFLDMKKALNWASLQLQEARPGVTAEGRPVEALFDGKGKKHITDDLRVYVSPEDVWERGDRDIPDSTRLLTQRCWLTESPS